MSPQQKQYGEHRSLMSCLDGPNAEGHQHDFRDFQPDRGGPLTESVSQPTGPRSKNDERQNQTAKSKRQNQRLFRFELLRRKPRTFQLILGDRNDQPAIHVIGDRGEKAHQQVADE